MTRELLIALGAAALVGGAAGCSNETKSSEPSSSTSSSSADPSASSTTPAAAGETRVIIGGQPQNVSGPVVCATNEGRFSIAVGDMVTGVIVGLEQDASVVHTAGLGTVDGVVMSFTEGAPGNTATATKNGSSYQIKGTATGVDNAGQQVSKAFEVDATCP
ncbi:Mycobacterium 19 kDa lipoprotein antigen [Mycobacterium basiliense]|uniref:Mycobacterium 19 kDa lipoprotein antigen n=1 Tax=Mycobacterium basiliense TaxID=2094119 RepID=A0A447GA74_9MYCO|nr:lipoprotein LpqH [Mycobacterium basiliense]VDM87403.1 Mycobacterium 19 kDa lipoprotein antigen [Mycobacterium basiliense]